MIFITDQDLYWSFCPLFYKSDSVIRHVSDPYDIRPADGLFASDEPSYAWLIEAKTAKSVEALSNNTEDIWVLVPPKVFWELQKGKSLSRAVFLDERTLKSHLHRFLTAQSEMADVADFLISFQGEAFQKIIPVIQILQVMRSCDKTTVINHDTVCSLMSPQDALIFSQKPIKIKKIPLHTQDYSTLVFETEKAVRSLRYSKSVPDSIKTIYDLTQAKILFKKRKSVLAFKSWFDK